MIGAAILVTLATSAILAVILYEPTAALYAAEVIEKTAAMIVLRLRAHAAGRTAARAAYRAEYHRVIMEGMS